MCVISGCNERERQFERKERVQAGGGIRSPQLVRFFCG